VDVLFGDEEAAKKRLEGIKAGMRAKKSDKGRSWCVFCGHACASPKSRAVICADCEKALAYGYIKEVLLSGDQRPV